MELIPQKLNELQKLIHPLLDGVQFLRSFARQALQGEILTETELSHE